VCIVFGALDASEIALFSVVFLGAFSLLLLNYIADRWSEKHFSGISPYTGVALRRGNEIPRESAKRVLRFLYDRQEYDNRIFTLKKAVFERETGRIYINAVSWRDAVQLDWSFLQKRYPGHYVSWGSLEEVQQLALKEEHERIEDFQLSFSSPFPAPKDITAEYVYTKPGPLYVDLETRVLLGWQSVPDTDFEVLIVQHPRVYWEQQAAGKRMNEDIGK
jgi:hypothetical protein